MCFFMRCCHRRLWHVAFYQQPTVGAFSSNCLCTWLRGCGFASLRMYTGTSSFELVGQGACSNADGGSPSYYYKQVSVDRSACEATCKQVPSCVAYDHIYSGFNKGCLLLGNSLSSYTGDALSGFTLSVRGGTDTITTVTELEDRVCYKKRIGKFFFLSCLSICITCAVASNAHLAVARLHIFYILERTCVVCP